MTSAKLRLARAAMVQPETEVDDLYKELGITRQTLYRFVSPTGELRDDGKKLLERRGIHSAIPQVREYYISDKITTISCFRT